MAYTNAVFYVDPEAGNDNVRTALTTVTVANPSGTITRATKTGHGLVTGAVVDLTAFSTWLNAAWKITVVDANTFDLDGAVWQATADANGTVTPRGGSSKADAWKTFSSGVSASRVSPGDAIRVMASPEPTLVGDVAWTQDSKTLTLPGAVTATICDCESAWTGSTNVTQTADTAQFKEGTKSAKSVVATAFTTGKIAYFATGTLDLSAYQQISFWFRSNNSIAAGALELRLCSDTTGDTTVHTCAIPANLGASAWFPLAFDFGTALSSSVQSVALWALLDPGTSTLNIDHIIACKASSSADALTLVSLIGKTHNLSWVASTAYSLNAIRRPTQPNRNGFGYRVTTAGTTGSSEPTWPTEYGATVTDGSVVWTCYDLEESWYPIQSIVGTTLKLDNGQSNLGNAGRGYDGATETVATYRREAAKLTMAGTTSGTNYEAKVSGTATAAILFSGGWDRSTMSVQNGETWLDAQNGYGSGFGTYSGGASYVTFENLNVARAYHGCNVYSGSFVTLRNCHAVSCTQGGLTIGTSTQQLTATGLVLTNGQTHGLYPSSSNVSGTIRRARLSSNLSDGYYSSNAANGSLRMSHIEALNNGQIGIDWQTWGPPRLAEVHTRNNGTYGMRLDFSSQAYLYRCLLEDQAPFAPMVANADCYIYSTHHGRVTDAHYIVSDGGYILSATDQRHTASGISWCFQPYSLSRHVRYPLVLPLGKIACAANEARNVTIWTRRSATTTKGALVVRGGQIAGVPADVTVACEPTINTWVQSGTLSFTPTAAGVVEILFLVWDGVDVSGTYWIDDLAVT